MVRPWLLAPAFVLGSLAGSFFYTLALRYASGAMRDNPRRALFSRSKCPSCGAAITPLSLVPILGYAIAKGRCRNCGAGISPLYPLAEIMYGFMGVLFAWKLGITFLSANLYLLACIALCIAVVDIKSMSIPDSLVIAFTVLSSYPVILNWNIGDNIFGLLVLAAVFLVILLIFPGSFGFGDVKYASAIGLLSGLELSFVVLETSLVTGAITGVIYALKTGSGLRIRIPFAPFLSLGLVVSMLWGREILLVYFRILY